MYVSGVGPRPLPTPLITDIEHSPLTSGRRNTPLFSRNSSLCYTPVLQLVKAVFNDVLNFSRAELQGYLAHKKHPPPRTLQ